MPPQTVKVTESFAHNDTCKYISNQWYFSAVTYSKYVSPPRIMHEANTIIGRCQAAACQIPFWLQKHPGQEV